LDFTGNGLADNGTVWAVRELQLPPGSWTIGLEFQVTAVPAPINQWHAVGFIGLREPQVEEDFTQSPEGEDFGAIVGDGWAKYSMDRTLNVAEKTTAWVAYGYNIVWETVRTHHFDAVVLTGVPVQCGNEECFAGEDPCNCPADCGPPAAGESVCDDGLDDDCDGFTDCVDSECGSDPVCADVVCDGDWVCETGENSCDCWMDCGPPPVIETDCGNPSLRSANSRSATLTASASRRRTAPTARMTASAAADPPAATACARRLTARIAFRARKTATANRAVIPRTSSAAATAMASTPSAATTVDAPAKVSPAHPTRP
jgi:hypothetical protein